MITCELQITVIQDCDNLNFKIDSSFLQFFWMQQLTRKGKSYSYVLSYSHLSTNVHLFIPPTLPPHKVLCGFLNDLFYLKVILLVK